MVLDLSSQAVPHLLNASSPIDGNVTSQIAATPIEEVRQIVARARAAQAVWRAKTWQERSVVLRRFWSILAGEIELWTNTIRDEIGKPRSEALGEVVMGLDGIRWTVKHGAGALKAERISSRWQRVLLIPSAHLSYQPLGVVGIIGTWNYPFYLNAPAILQAVAAGNAVIWKPSELALRSGELLQTAVDRAGFPEGLVSAVYGGADVGQALIESDLDKALFTGGVENGRRVLTELARRGVPGIAELSGFDSAIVLPDAPRQATVQALTWGTFVGAGQTCVAVKRIYVVGDCSPWIEGLATATKALRVGDPRKPDIDMGPMISEPARQRFDERIRAALELGAVVEAGGHMLPGSGWFYAPTLLSAKDDRAESALEGVFGPVALIRSVPDVESAIRAANSSVYGLASSVWGRNRRQLRAVAERLNVGLVTLNDVVAPTGHAAAPFGGTKASGFGRTHGVMGLREFTFPQVTMERGSRAFRPQIFPYRSGIEQLLGWYLRLFHPRG